MRSDDILYTGMTSRTPTLKKISDDKKEKQRLKQEKQVKLQKGVDIILELLDKEREKTVLKMLEAISTETPQEDIKSVIVSLNLYKETVNNLQSRIKSIMRDA
jgi:hypothetical protein